MTTPFSNKCAILAQVYIDYSEDEKFSQLCYTHDIGIPLAYAVSRNLAVANDDGMVFVDNAWEDFCEILGIDHYGEYDSFDSMMVFANE